MDILLDNLSWMTFNLFLAFLGVAFGFLFLQFKNLFLRALFFVFWLLFVPNTIYLITDLKWLPEQFPKLGWQNQIILLAQYLTIIILGIVTFFLGLYPLEKFLSKPKHRIKISTNSVMFLANYLIAFGVVLGRVERLNSWDVFINPALVIDKALSTLTSKESLIFLLLFGAIINILYFAWKRSKH